MKMPTLTSELAPADSQGLMYAATIVQASSATRSRFKMTLDDFIDTCVLDPVIAAKVLRRRDEDVRIYRFSAEDGKFTFRAKNSGQLLEQSVPVNDGDGLNLRFEDPVAFKVDFDSEERVVEITDVQGAYVGIQQLQVESKTSQQVMFPVREARVDVDNNEISVSFDV